MIVIFAQISQESRQHGGGLGLRVVQQDDSLARRLRAARSRASVPDFGVIGFQSLAQKSAPNTTIPRDCRKSSVAGVDSKPGKRKKGVDGVVVATSCSAISTASDAVDRSPRWCSLGLIRIRLRCVQRMVSDGMTFGRDPPHQVGCSEAGLPIRKKVARTHSRASAASTFGVVGGHGPSSKVSTTS